MDVSRRLQYCFPGNLPAQYGSTVHVKSTRFTCSMTPSTDGVAVITSTNETTIEPLISRVAVAGFPSTHQTPFPDMVARSLKNSSKVIVLQVLQSSFAILTMAEERPRRMASPMRPPARKSWYCLVRRSAACFSCLSPHLSFLQDSEDNSEDGDQDSDDDDIEREEDEEEEEEEEQMGNGGHALQGFLAGAFVGLLGNCGSFGGPCGRADIVLIVLCGILKGLISWIGALIIAPAARVIRSRQYNIVTSPRVNNTRNCIVC